MQTRIIDESKPWTRQIIATLMPSTGAWSDPHGGEFDKDEQASLWAFARGEASYVELVGREIVSPRLVIGR